ncbi:NACHT domain-containing protein [Streptomyces noursei]|uniref:NACHT domain-containing protein n=1 Tax=Streptomyces noursei TaxID=1971 RepID=UPI0039AFBFC0
MRTLTRTGAALPTPDGFLTAVGCPVSGAQPDGWAHRVLAAGRALLLIDGLDEIPERERRATLSWLRDLLDAFPGNLWLVTPRPSAVRDDWLTPDAPDPDVPDLLVTYEQSLLTAVRTKPDLGRLATNPLTCGLICALHHDRRGYLPHGRKELYDAALGMLLSRRDRERDMRGPDGVELADEPQIQLLQRLAYWLIRNGRTELDSQWEDVIRMTVAHARPRERAELLRGLLSKNELRTDLLAMACLEHATEIAPSVHKEIKERTAAILPPRSRNESKMLVDAGPFVLELLPGTGGLEDDEAEEVVHTAAALGTDAALVCLKRFRDNPSPDTRFKLGDSWHRFDTDRYAQEVIQHLPATANITVTSPALALSRCRDHSPQALDRLSCLETLILYSPLPPAGLDALPKDAPLTTLILGDEHTFPDLAPIRSWPSLTQLYLRKSVKSSGTPSLCSGA